MTKFLSIILAAAVVAAPSVAMANTTGIRLTNDTNHYVWVDTVAHVSPGVIHHGFIAPHGTKDISADLPIYFPAAYFTDFYIYVKDSNSETSRTLCHTKKTVGSTSSSSHVVYVPATLTYSNGHCDVFLKGWD